MPSSNAFWVTITVSTRLSHFREHLSTHANDNNLCFVPLQPNLHCTVVQTVMGLMDTVSALAIVLSALRTTAHVAMPYCPPCTLYIGIRFS